MSLLQKNSFPFGTKDLSTREVIDYLLLLMQNIIAGTVTISENFLEKNCLECKIHLNAGFPMVVLQYAVDSLVTECVQLQSFDYFDEPGENLSKCTDISDVLCKDFRKITKSTNSADEVKPKTLMIFEVPGKNNQRNQEIIVSKQERCISFINLHDKQEFIKDSQNNICQILNFNSPLNSDENLTDFVEREMLSELSNTSDLELSELKQNFSDNGSWNKNFEKSIKIQDHLLRGESVTSSDAYSCSYCGKSCSKKFHKDTLKTAHTSYSCDHCHKMFIILSSLSFPNCDKVFSCHECGISLANSNFLLQQRTLHNGKRSNGECGKHFNQLDNRSDQQICSNETSYFCKSCGKIVTKPGKKRKFSEEDSLRRQQYQKNYYIQRKRKETEEEREIRLEKQRKNQRRLRQNESEEKRAQRLSQMRMYRSRQLASESKEQRERRLTQARIGQTRRLANESEEHRAQRLFQVRTYQAQRLAKESEEQRAQRLYQVRTYQAKRLARESKEQHKRQLSQTRAFPKRKQTSRLEKDKKPMCK